MDIKKSEPEELYKHEQIEGTPFTVITDVEKNIHFGVFGNYKFTEDKTTKQDVINELVTINYDNIVKLCSCIIHKLNSK